MTGIVTYFGNPFTYEANSEDFNSMLDVALNVQLPTYIDRGMNDSTIYVSRSSLDNPNCGSYQTPCQSFVYAISLTKPGDTIVCYYMDESWCDAIIITNSIHVIFEFGTQNHSIQAACNVNITATEV